MMNLTFFSKEKKFTLFMQKNKLKNHFSESTNLDNRLVTSFLIKSMNRSCLFHLQINRQ